MRIRASAVSPLPVSVDLAPLKLVASSNRYCETPTSMFASARWKLCSDSVMPAPVLNAADLARHPDPSVRGGAAHALAAATTPNALTMLESLLRDQQPLPRLMAARALGKSQLKSLISPLKTGLQDSDPTVRISFGRKPHPHIVSKRQTRERPLGAENQHAQIHRAIDATSPLVRIRIPLGQTADE